MTILFYLSKNVKTKITYSTDIYQTRFYFLIIIKNYVQISKI